MKETVKRGGVMGRWERRRCDMLKRCAFEEDGERDRMTGNERIKVRNVAETSSEP